MTRLFGGLLSYLVAVVGVAGGAAALLFMQSMASVAPTRQGATKETAPRIQAWLDRKTESAEYAARAEPPRRPNASVPKPCASKFHPRPSMPTGHARWTPSSNRRAGGNARSWKLRNRHGGKRGGARASLRVRTSRRRLATHRNRAGPLIPTNFAQGQTAVAIEGRLAALLDLGAV
jgi:hypothetical protein